LLGFSKVWIIEPDTAFKFDSREKQYLHNNCLFQKNDQLFAICDALKTDQRIAGYAAEFGEWGGGWGGGVI